ncbi:MAG: phosphonoacetaldehyde reductase [Endomicrobium sp.]|jgi:alcohol dehydrogenase class IV|uniref:phosphonoacetaldehyde reductase n=1 Tax=Candidatus Endomicrobiellum cubanum TaxID=3242325 RepID=UPI0028382878|nr:phosphonoacetaldehyde reductase [Endomicrobium sp.]
MKFIKNKTFFGINCVDNLSNILKKEKVRYALIFTAKKSFKLVEPILKKQIYRIDSFFYNDFSTTPKENEIKLAISALSDKSFDVIIAIGGGSVIDFAKLFKFYTNSLKKLIAIPTTIGTGSEATKFAVLYVNGEKVSVEDENILPDYSIVDSQFAQSIPKYIKGCGALDAYCQAIESYWSVKSTPESIIYSQRAIKLCKENLIGYVNNIELKYSERMALASNLSGKAINISKTTAAHALSYKITSLYGLPHGHAVSLSIAGLMELHLHTNSKNCNDIRGNQFVINQMIKLYKLIGISDAREYFKKLFEDIGIEYNLNKLGILDIDSIINSVNKGRLKNNPRILSYEDMKTCLNKWN